MYVRLDLTSMQNLFYARVKSSSVLGTSDNILVIHDNQLIILSLTDSYQICDIFGGRKRESENTKFISQCELSKFITFGTFNKTLLSI